MWLSYVDTDNAANSVKNVGQVCINNKTNPNLQNNLYETAHFTTLYLLSFMGVITHPFLKS